MTLPIKTQLLNQIKTDLATITMVKSVLLNPVVLPKADQFLEWPLVCISDEPETVKRDNRLRQGQFTLWIEGWIWSDTEAGMTALQDELAAQIQMKMIGDSAGQYRNFCQNVIELSLERYFESMNECAIVNKYEIWYRTAIGNPYTQNIS